jgi:excisionase family DNA binding protein
MRVQMTKRMPKTAKPVALTMTIEAAARELGISRNTAYECARTGQIPTVRLGRRLLVPRVALANMLRGEDRAPEVKTSTAKAA